jgi:RES domain-containing protein
MAEGQGRGPASFLPRALHAITINQLAVLDLTTEDAMVAVGLDHTDLDGPWDPFQAVGAAAHFLRLGGVVAPSATGAGVIIAVFEAHVGPGQLAVQSTEIIRVADLA